mgnify:CR=1 FL=1
MMATRIGVNGFGRIGRQVTRAIIETYPQKLEVAAVNDLADAKTNAHLFKYDTNYGPYAGMVEASNGDLIVDGSSIRVFSERDPAQIPWSEMGVDLVVESTGIFTDADFRRAILKDSDVFSQQIDNYMTSDPIKVESGMLVADALKVFEENRIDDLLVVDADNKPIGIIDGQDLPKLRIV